MAERILTGSPKRPLDPKTFGLEPAVGRLTLVANGTPTVLLFGELTPIHSNRYVKVSDRSEMFVVSSGLYDTANHPLETFRDPFLLHLDTWLVDELRVTSPTATVALKRSNNDWDVTQPFNDRAERSKVNALLRRLEGLRIKRFLNDAPQVEQLSTWGFDHPQVEVRLHEREAPEAITLFFGGPLADEATLLYAKRSDEPPLYAAAAADVESLLKDPQALRATTCFEFFTSSVRQVEVEQEGKRWVIERANLTGSLGAAPTGISWREKGSGTTLETLQVDQFLSKLADMRLSGFVEEAPSDLSRYGLKPPAGTIAVWTVGQETPQRLSVGGRIEGSADRYGRIDAREVVVRLPDLVTELLATPPAQFQVTTPSSVTSP